MFAGDTLLDPPRSRQIPSHSYSTAPSQRPRPIVLCLHRYQSKELRIREVRRRGKLELLAKPICIVEDCSPEVFSQRAQSRALQIRPVLYLYPARLRLTMPEGARKWISLVDEARKYHQRLHVELLSYCGATIVTQYHPYKCDMIRSAYTIHL